MKAWTVIGYTYEADCHCVDCAVKRFGFGTAQTELPGDALLDENDIPADQLDNEGNPIHPIFASDEGESICGDCFAEIQGGAK